MVYQTRFLEWFVVCDCSNTKFTWSVHPGGCAHEQECPVHAMSHSDEGPTAEKIRSQCFHMVVWIWKHPKHQVFSEMMALMGKDLHCSAWTKEHLWTSVGLWVLHRKTEMKNRILLQIHVMLSFHLSPWEHKGVYAVLSGACDPVNNNSWTCWGWCQLLDHLLWQPESLLSKWSCAPCGWSTGHSGLQRKAAHGWSWSCVRGDLSVLWSLCSLHAWIKSEKVFLIPAIRFMSLPINMSLR